MIFPAITLHEGCPSHGADSSPAPGGSGGYVGRCTAPLLVDRQRLKAMSQDSEEIVRMIATAEVSQTWEFWLIIRWSVHACSHDKS